MGNASGRHGKTGFRYPVLHRRPDKSQDESQDERRVLKTASSGMATKAADQVQDTQPDVDTLLLSRLYSNGICDC